mgnify:CR=1 FL=1|tara:strand:+ start:446 stop:925 length:480 start_codon:yes stop_codon:yes gene_type:complete
MTTTFADELGKVAAVALDKKERTKQVELEMLRTHLEEEWKRRMRNDAMLAAKAGKTAYTGRFKTAKCGFTVLQPTNIDVCGRLPDELRAMYKNNNVRISQKSECAPSFWPEFDVTITFATQAAESLGKLKRERQAAEERDKADVSTKKVKAEPKVKVED